MVSDELLDIQHLERQFHLRVVRYFHETRKSRGPLLEQLIWDTAEVGGLLAVRRILHRGGWPFSRFLELQRVGDSLEALIIHEEQWQPLFTDMEIDMARQRLRGAGYVGRSEDQ